MIALLLATQLSALALPAQPSAQLPPSASSHELVRVLPGKQACMANPPGRMEVSTGVTPAALYRKGDRPAKGLRKWADYPDGVLCAVGATR